MASYQKGSLINLRGEFHDVDNADALYDPAVPQFRIMAPNGAVTVYTYPGSAQILKDAVGKYRVRWTFDQVGRYIYQFDSTDGARPPDERTVDILPTVF